MRKTQLIESIQDVSEDFSVEVCMERLLVMQKIKEEQQLIAPDITTQAKVTTLL